MYDTKNFVSAEFKCDRGKCQHCGGIEFMDQGFIERLQRARSCAQIPFHINSGWRCPEHNAEIGGVDNSAHITGNAVDIRARNSRQRFIIVKALLWVGFTRIGVYGTYIHVDDSAIKKDRILWLSTTRD